MAASHWLTADEQCAWRSYINMRRILESHLAQQMQQSSGLSPSDFEILVNLSESRTGRMRAVELGRATRWEKTRVSHHLNRMEKRGLICKEEGQGRYPDIAITDRGWDAIRQCAPHNAARVREVFVDALGPDRLEIVRHAFVDIVAAVERRENLDEANHPDPVLPDARGDRDHHQSESTTGAASAAQT